MSPKLWLSATASLLMVLCSFAAEPAKKQADLRKIEVVFDDGSTVKMTMLQDTIEITSRYGTFKVPVEEITRIEFGFRYPEGVEQRVRDGITGLGGSNFRQRETATNELLELGEYSHLALQEASKSSDAEVAKRDAEELLKKIEEKVGEERLSIPRHDVVHTKQFPIVGRIESDHFKAKTPYFGEIKVTLAEIRSFRSLGATSQIAFSIDAAKYASCLNPNEWRETDIDLSKDSILEIEASGTIQIYQGGGYQTTPDGYKQHYVQQGMPHPGALIGRVGTKGTPFIIGSKYKGKPNEQGRLYVRIQQSPWNNESTGSYEVKIKSTFGIGRDESLMPIKPRETPKTVIVPPFEKKKD